VYVKDFQFVDQHHGINNVVVHPYEELPPKLNIQHFCSYMFVEKCPPPRLLHAFPVGLSKFCHHANINARFGLALFGTIVYL